MCAFKIIFDSYEEWIHMLPKKVKALFITMTPEEIALFEYDREYHNKIKELRREYIVANSKTIKLCNL